MNVLVVEDEPDLSKSICQYLTQNKFVCQSAPDYRSALGQVETGSFDCIVLDISLPDGNGLNLLNHLKRANKAEGVVIISAKKSLDDKILGLELGADDYLAKPFHLAELSARVSAVIRRKCFDGHNVIIVDEFLKLDLLEKSVIAGGHDVDLTRKEYEMLCYFLSNRNRVVTKESITEHLWGDQAHISDGYDFIYSHIKNLRKKLADAGCPDYIKAVYGMGYKFKVN